MELDKVEKLAQETLSVLASIKDSLYAIRAESERLLSSIKSQITKDIGRAVKELALSSDISDAIRKNKQLKNYELKDVIDKLNFRLYSITSSLDKIEAPFAKCTQSFKDFASAVVSARDRIIYNIGGRGVTAVCGAIENISYELTDEGFQGALEAIRQTDNLYERMDKVQKVLALFPDAIQSVNSKQDKLRARLKLSPKTSPESQTAKILLDKTKSAKKTLHNRAAILLNEFSDCRHKALNRLLAFHESVALSVRSSKLQEVARDSMKEIFSRISAINDNENIIKGKK